MRMVRRKIYWIVLFLLAAAGMAGCGEPPIPGAVVTLSDGTEIRLNNCRFRYTFGATDTVGMHGELKSRRYEIERSRLHLMWSGQEIVITGDAIASIEFAKGIAIRTRSGEEYRFDQYYDLQAPAAFLSDKKHVFKKQIHLVCGPISKTPERVDLHTRLYYAEGKEEAESIYRKVDLIVFE